MLAVTIDCSDVISITADPIRLRQIVVNLVSNAIKFTPQYGEVSIAAIEEGRAVRISVKDTATDIAEADQNNIFAKFYQAGVTTSGVRDETGLGLAICQRLVEMQGRHIIVESRLGKAAHFPSRCPSTLYGHLIEQQIRGRYAGI